jgi:hypothetical protein
MSQILGGALGQDAGMVEEMLQIGIVEAGGRQDDDAHMASNTSWERRHRALRQNDTEKSWASANDTGSWGCVCVIIL